MSVRIRNVIDFKMILMIMIVDSFFLLFDDVVDCLFENGYKDGRGGLQRLVLLMKELIGNLDRSVGIVLDKLLLLILNIVKFVKFKIGMFFENELLWRFSK